MYIVSGYSPGRGDGLLPNVVQPWQAVWGVLLHLYTAPQQNMERDEGIDGGLSQGQCKG